MNIKTIDDKGINEIQNCPGPDHKACFISFKGRKSTYKQYGSDQE